MVVAVAVAVVSNLFFYLNFDNDFQGQEKFMQSIRTDIISLRQLKVGQPAKVVTVSAHGELGRRIRDMGLIPGAEVCVVGKAPLQDPVALRLKGFTLSLRNSEADFITVEPLAHA